MLKDEQILEMIKQNFATNLVKNIDGLIHNLNSPLNNIMGYTLLAQQKNPAVPELKKILSAADSINSLLQNLNQALEFFQMKKKQRFSFPELIQTELELLQHSLFFKHKVEIHFSESDNSPTFLFLYSDFAMIFSILTDLSRLILEKEMKKVISIHISENDKAVFLTFEIAHYIPFQCSDEKKYQDKLSVSEHIIALLLKEYQGIFHHKNIENAIVYVIQIPQGV
jgi:signal transduction histidine kinase